MCLFSVFHDTIKLATSVKWDEAGVAPFVTELPRYVLEGRMRNRKDKAAVMSERITHIRKPDRDDRHEAISHYGQRQPNGTVDVFEREAFVKYLTDHGVKAYVNEDGKGAWCKIMDNGRIKYLQTEADSTDVNNLLNLPSC